MRITKKELARFIVGNAAAIAELIHTSWVGDAVSDAADDIEEPGGETAKVPRQLTVRWSFELDTLKRQFRELRTAHNDTMVHITGSIDRETDEAYIIGRPSGMTWFAPKSCTLVYQGIIKMPASMVAHRLQWEGEWIQRHKPGKGEQGWSFVVPTGGHPRSKFRHAIIR